MKIVHKNVAIKAETCSWHHACTFGMKILEPPLKHPCWHKSMHMLITHMISKCTRASKPHMLKKCTCYQCTHAISACALFLYIKNMSEAHFSPFHLNFISLKCFEILLQGTCVRSTTSRASNASSR